MIAHYLKLIWKRRGRNSFLFVELILVFWVVFAVLAFGISRYNYYTTPLGFQWEDVYRVSFSTDPDSTQGAQVLENLKQNIKDLSEVQSAAYSISVAPYWGNTWSSGNDTDNFVFNTDYLMSDKDYADVFNIKLKEGRYFTDEDKTAKETPIIVSQKFVDEYLKGKKAIGFKFNLQEDYPVKIIGVAENFKYQGDFSKEEPFSFLPLRRWNLAECLNIKLKPGVDKSIEKTINTVIEQTLKSGDFSVTKIEDSRKNMNSSTYIPLVAMLFLAIFLIINIAMGLFGILRYNTARRIPEIGLRKVIGATAGNIRRQFIGEIMVLTALACIVAVAFAAQLPFITTLPVETEVFFMGMGIGVVLIFLIVYLCAIFPSSQAAKIVPATALHEN